MTKRAPKGTPTGLNVSTLAEQFDTSTISPAAGDSAPAMVSPTSGPGLRRCLKAGYAVITGKGRDARLELTEAGAEAIRAYFTAYPTLRDGHLRGRERVRQEQTRLGIDPTTHTKESR